MFSTNDIDKRMQKCYNMCTYPYADFALFLVHLPMWKVEIKVYFSFHFYPDRYEKQIHER